MSTVWIDPLLWSQEQRQLTQEPWQAKSVSVANRSQKSHEPTRSAPGISKMQLAVNLAAIGTILAAAVGLAWHYLVL